MSDSVNMLKQLKIGLKQLGTAKKALDQLSGELINKLPEDKRKEASKLFQKAKTGKMDVNEFLSFAGNMNKKDEQKIKEGAERVDGKKKEVVKNTSNG